MKVRRFYLVLVVCLGFLGLATPQKSVAQSRRVVQLSGVVTDTAGTFLPGVNFYVPKAGRGTTSFNNGFFSLPTLTGDTVLVSCVGFHSQTYVVPQDAKEFTSILFEMHQNVTYLENVYVTMPTEELFKEAVLALNVPVENTGIDPKQMNAELLALMVKTTPMDGNANYRYYIEQFSHSADNKFHPIYNPFLNPINWVKFFKDIKKKKKAEQNKN
jgi:hypothetical protein